MENMDDFKKKLEDLAKEREEKVKAEQAMLIRQREEYIKNKKEYKESFNLFKRDVVYRIVEESKNAFQNSGDLILLYDNEHASAFEDRIKIFFQVLYYFNGRPMNIVGRNTPSLLYELNDNSGIINVKRYFKMGDIRNKNYSIKVLELNKEGFELEMLEFLTSLKQH